MKIFNLFIFIFIFYFLSFQLKVQMQFQTFYLHIKMPSYLILAYLDIDGDK